MSTSYSGKTTVQGAGGRFQSGGGSMDMGDGLNVPITVTFYTDSSGAEQAVQEVHKIGEATNEAGKKTGKLTEATKEHEKASQKQLSAMRSVTWDFMLLGRSASIVNQTFLGGNQVLKDMIGIIYGASAIMRVFLVLKDLARVKSLLFTTATTAETAAVNAQATAYRNLAAAEMSAEAFSGPIGWLGLGIGVASTAAAAIPQAASGGFVAQSGLAVIHKGETIIPKGGPAMTMININMQTGGISSNIDVNNLLNAMASKMALESRRRNGK